MIERMLVVALTGGIAAGKSTIGAQLAELGALRIDADGLAREAVEPGTPGLAAIAKVFGANVVTDEGELNRPALGEIVFSDPEALATLNAIVHPEVHRLLAAAISRARGSVDVVVYEVPLLAESGRGIKDQWDLVVTAEAPVETRVARMRELRGMSDADARARIASQAKPSQRRAIADVVIETGGTLDHTRAQTEQLWRRLQSMRSR